MRIQRTGTMIGIVIVLATGMQPSRMPPMGGFPDQTITDLQSVLSRKEEILAQQLGILEEEYGRVEREKKALVSSIVRAGRKKNIAVKVQLEKRLARLQSDDAVVRDARDRLIALSKDKERYEEFLAQGMQEVMVARLQVEDSKIPKFQNSKKISKEKDYKNQVVVPEQYTFAWPVYPAQGISAYFHDESYRKHFGFAHNAIDIPVRQGTQIRASGGGYVEQINDNGYGYSTLVIRHGYDIKTVYGHVSEFLVKEGQQIAEGQIIAMSGGLPGTKGAGPYTTGAHLHFETIVEGAVRDPLVFLPSLSIVFNQEKPAVGGGGR